ncbi:MAG: nuclear transport factor 2 family protein [Pseudomonadota bacterium]
MSKTQFFARAAAALFYALTISCTSTKSTDPDYIAQTEAYFQAVDNVDYEAFLALWAPDGEFLVPFLPSQNLIGYDQIATAFKPRFAAAQSAVTTRDIKKIHGAPQTLAKAQFTIDYKNGVRYENDAVILFTYNGDGRLVRLEEWIDPDRFRAAFGDPAPAE